MNKTHDYTARLEWNGNLGHGTATYAGYGRDYTVEIAGKAAMRGSADPMFRGSADLHNPEDLFIAAVSACHMLTYLALCARKGVNVTAYEDDAKGTLELTADGGGRFREVTLHPVVTVADAATESLAMSLHDDAHRLCFIAQSSSSPIHHVATIRIASDTT